MAISPYPGISLKRKTNFSETNRYEEECSWEPETNVKAPDGLNYSKVLGCEVDRSEPRQRWHPLTGPRYPRPGQRAVCVGLFGPALATTPNVNSWHDTAAGYIPYSSTKKFS